MMGLSLQKISSGILDLTMTSTLKKWKSCLLIRYKNKIVGDLIIQIFQDGWEMPFTLCKVSTSGMTQFWILPSKIMLSNIKEKSDSSKNSVTLYKMTRTRSWKQYLKRYNINGRALRSPSMTSARKSLEALRQENSSFTLITGVLKLAMKSLTIFTKNLIGIRMG